MSSVGIAQLNPMRLRTDYTSIPSRTIPKAPPPPPNRMEKVPRLPWVAIAIVTVLIVSGVFLLGSVTTVHHQVGSSSYSSEGTW